MALRCVAGAYFSPGWQKSYPCIQILTVKELLAGKGIAYTAAGLDALPYKKASKATSLLPEPPELPWDAVGAWRE